MVSKPELVATCEAPKLRSIQVFPVIGIVTSMITVGPEAQNTDPGG